jgi:hypothetical protein
VIEQELSIKPQEQLDDKTHGDLMQALESLESEQAVSARLSTRPLDDDAGLKLRLTNRGVLDLDAPQEGTDDAPFKDSDDEELERKKDFKPFTTLTNRTAKYSRRITA